MKVKLVAVLAAVALSLGLLAAPAAAHTPPPSLLDIVVASGGEFDDDRRDFDILLNAALAIGETDNPIVATLADPNADVTVFAPNDLGFIRLAQDLGFAGSDEAGAFAFIAENLPAVTGADLRTSLINVILYHVSPGAKNILEVLFAEDIPTALPGSAPLGRTGFRLVDAAAGLEDPRFVLPIAGASNGVVYAINRVLVPLPL